MELGLKGKAILITGAIVPMDGSSSAVL